MKQTLYNALTLLFVAMIVLASCSEDCTDLKCENEGVAREYDGNCVCDCPRGFNGDDCTTLDRWILTERDSGRTTFDASTFCLDVFGDQTVDLLRISPAIELPEVFMDFVERYDTSVEVFTDILDTIQVFEDTNAAGDSTFMDSVIVVGIDTTLTPVTLDRSKLSLVGVVNFETIEIDEQVVNGVTVTGSGQFDEFLRDSLRLNLSFILNDQGTIQECVNQELIETINE